jgi:transposase-like protein
MTELPGLLEFMQQHPTEQACRERLRQLRWGDGFTCPRCDETERYSYIRTREKWQCNACRYQCSVTAGTILENAKIPVQKWFLALYLAITNKKGTTGYDLARKLQVTTKTGFFLHHKIMTVLRCRPKQRLKGAIEVDEAFFGGKRADGSRGRGTSKPMVIGLVERRGKKTGRLRLLRLPEASEANLQRVIDHHVEPGSRIVTDGWVAYRGIQGYEHDRRIGQATENLPWIHTVFSNAKRVIYGVNSYTSDAGLAAYLAAFEYRYDHRNHLGTGVERAIKLLARVKPLPQRSMRLHPPGTWRSRAATCQ